MHGPPPGRRYPGRIGPATLSACRSSSTPPAVIAFRGPATVSEIGRSTSRPQATRRPDSVDRRSGDCRLAGAQADDARRSGSLLGSGDPIGADAAARLSLGPTASRGFRRQRPSAAWARPIHSRPHHLKPAQPEVLRASAAHGVARFADIDLGREPVPDETTVCKFRHLLERHDLGRQLFEQVHEHLEAQRPEGGHRHDRRCDDHQCAELDQERGQGARSRDASDRRRATSGISG